MATPLTCTDGLRSAAELIKSAIVKMDDGSYALKVSTTTGGDPVECAEWETPLEEMLRGAIVKEGSEFAFQIQSVT